MKNFNTHVYAVVRVKVIGTNFDEDPRVVADKVADAVCADASNWLQPVHGSVDVEGHGSFDIEFVEFADATDGILVDEIDTATGAILQEHHFDDKRSILSAVAEVKDILAQHPEANIGNKKVHYALMRLKGILEHNT